MLMTGTKLLHVPYKGSAPAVADLVAGHVMSSFDSMQSTMPFIRTKRLRALGLAALKRSSAAPEIPTISEQGVTGFEVGSWYGLLAPANTPREIVTRLHAEIGVVMKQPEVIERLAGAGVEPAMMSPEEFAAYIESETARYAKVVKSSGARLD